MIQSAEIELSINSNTTRSRNKLVLKFLDIPEICYMIQRLNLYNLLTEKLAKKVPYRPGEKS